MKRPAFTMLELIFVMLILGIVSSIGASVIAKIYESYLLQKSVHNISIKTELAAEQIVNRLQFSMPQLVVARDPNNFATVRDLYVDVGGDTTRTILEWIAYDNDSFTASSTPGWSGFADLNSSRVSTDAEGHSIRTPGSDLNATDIIIRNLSQNAVSTTIARKDRPNLIFSGDIPYRLGISAASDTMYRANCLGLGSIVDTGCSIPITTNHYSNAHDRINFTRPQPINMGEFYKIAWSAYALVPTDLNATTNDFDLVLHSNYQPWHAERYDDAATKKNILIKNVTVFKFMESGDTLRFKLCAKEFISGTTNFVSSCKEKVVIR